MLPAITYRSRTTIATDNGVTLRCPGASVGGAPLTEESLPHARGDSPEGDLLRLPLDGAASVAVGRWVQHSLMRRFAPIDEKGAHA